LSILGVGSLCLAFPRLQILVSVLAFSHYFIALIYSKKYLSASVRSTKGATGLLFLTILGFYFGIQYKEYIALVFGVHHILSEVYLVHDKRFQGNIGPRYGLFTVSRIILGLSVYCNIVRHHRLLDHIPSSLLINSLLASCILFIAAFYLNKGYFEKKQINDIAVFEGIGIIFALASYTLFPNIKILPMHIIIYHAVFWMFYPLKGLSQAGKNQMFKYVGITLVVTLAFIILAVKPMLSGRAGFNFWWNIFVIWGYVHILQSIALSTSNPLPLVRLFETHPKASTP